MLPKLTFVLGGAASGKSVWAENLLLTSGLEPVYLATSRVFDDEIKLRINAHKSRRRDEWRNFEQDIYPGEVLATCDRGQGVLIDCATMWLTNVILDDMDILAERDRLLRDIASCSASVIVVSNEVGHGIVPENALARQFREEQGRLNIALAAAADLAVLVTAGLPQVLRGTLP
nr:bifunctional adenosylcobinamide kinase/adenosylcobinamide-phosphate guanylyltransferase [uncultured Roseobacter sp.]